MGGGGRSRVALIDFDERDSDIKRKDRYCTEAPHTTAIAIAVTSRYNLHPALVDIAKGFVNMHVRTNLSHAVHPSGAFCDMCGLNSKEFVHTESCPVGIAESVLTRATQSL